jgi:hypothetical protein
MVQTVRIHQDNNHLVKLCLSQFKEMVSRPNLQEDIAVQISDGRFYVGDEKVQYRKEFTRIIARCLIFKAPGSDRSADSRQSRVDLDDLLGFVRLLIHSAKKMTRQLFLHENQKELLVTI